MEENQKSVTMNGITWGVIAAVLVILYGLILYLLDQSLNTSISWIGYLFFIGIMIWGTITYRKTLPGGFMSYGKAFSTSFMIVLFATIIAGIYSYLFFSFIAPDLIQDIIEVSRQQNLERNPDITDEQLEQAMQMTAFFFTPIGMAIAGFFSQLIIGTVVALITSIFLKKEDKTLGSSAI
ncbi:MAG: DUF4199 domain-containing protein [Bacteroidales bacterium]|nr:DUF4199 domain-containing protein [Bacteroidales bacterium]